MCSQRLYKLLKNNRSVEVIKACNTKAVYILVTHLLLGVFKPLILIRFISTLQLSGNDRINLSSEKYCIKNLYRQNYEKLSR